MKTIVVYDSLYGNTKRIAQAIANAILGETSLLHMDEVNSATLAGVELLVLGAPTHGGQPSDAVKRFLQNAHQTTLTNIKVAAFDTRMSWRWLKLFGFAAPKIARRLKKMSGTLVLPAEGFFVQDSEGPLKEGEEARAAAWAKKVVLAVG